MGQNGGNGGKKILAMAKPGSLGPEAVPENRQPSPGRGDVQPDKPQKRLDLSHLLPSVSL